MRYGQNSSLLLMQGEFFCVWIVHKTLCSDRAPKSNICKCVMATYEVGLYKVAYMQGVKLAIPLAIPERYPLVQKTSPKHKLCVYFLSSLPFFFLSCFPSSLYISTKKWVVIGPTQKRYLF